METKAQLDQFITGKITWNRSAIGLLTEAVEMDVALTRSKHNIAEWCSYLPRDCVSAMIARGWDLST